MLGLGLVNLALTWNLQLARAAAIGHGAGWVFGTVAFGWGIILLLLWLIAYRGSNVTKWVFVVMNGLGFLMEVAIWKLLAQNGALPLAITLVLNALALFSIWMLFRRDARDWLTRRPPVDPEIFR